jgi:hypothetical protein
MTVIKRRSPILGQNKGGFVQRFGAWRSWGIQGTNVQFSTNVDWNTIVQIYHFFPNFANTVCVSRMDVARPFEHP